MKDVTTLSPEELLLTYVNTLRSRIVAGNVRNIDWDEYHRLNAECIVLEWEILTRLRK